MTAYGTTEEKTIVIMVHYLLFYCLKVPLIIPSRHFLCFILWSYIWSKKTLPK